MEHHEECSLVPIYDEWGHLVGHKPVCSTEVVDPLSNLVKEDVDCDVVGFKVIDGQNVPITKCDIVHQEPTCEVVPVVNHYTGDLSYQLSCDESHEPEVGSPLAGLL